jgi:TATA-binding protein-associated factor
MPTYRFPAALITLYYSDEEHPPWCYSRWQEITGIKDGLFPKDDALLPGGWDRTTAGEVSSFFDRFKQIKGEEERKKFVSRSPGQDVHPGREKWHTFCTSLWKRTKLHTIIVGAFRTAGLHPVDIFRSLPGESNVFPPLAHYMAPLVDAVAIAIFGHEATFGGNGNLKVTPLPHLCAPLHGFVMRSWDALKMAHNNSSQKLPNLEAEANSKLEGKSLHLCAVLLKADLNIALNNEASTSQDFRLAMKAVNQFLLRAQLAGTNGTVKRADKMKAEIVTILEGMRKDVEPSNEESKSKGKGNVILKSITIPADLLLALCKLTKDSLKKLASDEDVEDLVRLYEALFSDLEDTYEDPVVDVADEAVTQCFKDLDLGVEKESKMNIDELSLALGYTNRLPFLFNPSRHGAGCNPWDDAEAFDESAPNFDPEKITPSALHWHQVAGAHAIFRTVFSKPTDGKENYRGMLIADEVGLGKTAMVITVLATLSHLVWIQKNNDRVPRLFRE